MPKELSSVIVGLGVIIDCIGVLVILAGVIYSTLSFLSTVHKLHDTHVQYRAFRTNLGRSVILGLELILAGDIIRTVAGIPTLEQILGLGLIVIIRSFLGILLEVEVDGRWPWAKNKASQFS